MSKPGTISAMQLQELMYAWVQQGSKIEDFALCHIGIELDHRGARQLHATIEGPDGEVYSWQPSRSRWVLE